MAVAYKVLGQSKPSAATQTTLYTVPASTEAIVSSLIVCNQSAVATSFRCNIDLGGGGDESKEYIYYDLPIDGNDTFIATVGLTLATTDLVRVYATLATLSFSLMGSEVS